MGWREGELLGGLLEAIAIIHWGGDGGFGSGSRGDHILNIEAVAFASGLVVECEWKDMSQGWLRRRWSGLGLGYISSLWDMLNSGCPLEVHMIPNPTPRNSGYVNVELRGDKTEGSKTHLGADSLWILGKYMRLSGTSMKVALCLFCSLPHMQGLEYSDMHCVNEWSKQQPTFFPASCFTKLLSTLLRTISTISWKVSLNYRNRNTSRWPYPFSAHSDVPFTSRFHLIRRQAFAYLHS